MRGMQRVNKKLKKKLGKRCEIVKKGANLEEFLMENLCKPYIFLEKLNGRIKFRKYFLKKV